eukprot:CAMPEP_0172534026 /NCGR_PEP_ID=MMETSP1067-20121228/6541_1 /TAXON_ID=265564 ORGANISM="Thalassiosira punctigera, Strain Tpunct2005C2" /NCGR_SAMPLE_ID=MMETSP1067 /ASSEMBLY_ACC=CAM_ASM_000444 /LENGTH=734 /DNA_ID=CAMNT_0013318759 /DNA_START=118 /DNA_END=2319 /DNA_ORIENTATION=+
MSKPTVDQNGNGTAAASPTNGEDIASFDGGEVINGNGNGNGNSRKKGRKKRKKKKIGKETDRTPSPSTVAVPPSISVLHNGDKRSHDDLATAAPSSSSDPPQKKHRSSPSRSELSLPYMMLCLVSFALGALITIPLIFTTITYVGCGRTEIDSMVDLVLTVKLRRGEGSMPAMLRHLDRMPGSDNDAVVDGRGKMIRKKEEEKKKTQGGDSLASVGEAAIDPTTALHESMCQVSSVVIGNFVHYLPYAQWLVFRNPFHTTVAYKASLEAAQEIEPHKEEASKRKGIFQRVVSKHKQKHLEHPSSSRASEEIDRKHPIQRILEGASIFLHHRKEKIKRRKEKMKKKQQKKQQGGQSTEDGERDVDWKKWKYAMSDDYVLTSDEVRMVKDFAHRVIAKAATISVCPGSNTTDCSENEKQVASLSGGAPMSHQPFRKRLDAVSWGGIHADSAQWWGLKDAKDDGKISTQSEGGRLLTAYLKIMKWPSDMHAKYPFRLCAKGCEAEVSVLHTLEWRQKYRPWCVPDSVTAFNKDGFIYSRGHSRAGPRQRQEAAKLNGISSLSKMGHSMVYYRPGFAIPDKYPEEYMRIMTHALESAVADSLVRNDGAVGRFNVVMDCAGMGSKNSPSIAQVKTFFSVLQDHFPDRLGVLLAVNLSGLTTMLMKMVLPFVTEDVRAKIHIVPSDPEERWEMLGQFMEKEQVPYYLGGRDEYRFDAKEYYRDACVLPEEEIMEYRTSMP